MKLLFRQSQRKKKINNLRIKKIIPLSTEKQNDVRAQRHKSETRGNTKFSGTFAAPYFETSVFVPFMRIINFTGVLSEMLLNRILFTFTRKMETNWLGSRLVNFPLSFFLCLQAGLSVGFSQHFSFFFQPEACLKFLIKDI